MRHIADVSLLASEVISWRNVICSIYLKQVRYNKLIMKYVCDVCGWEYDEEKGYPEGGIAPGTKWEDIPDDFECPLCSVGKDQFSVAE